MYFVDVLHGSSTIWFEIAENASSANFISLLKYNNKFHTECTKLWHYAHWMWFSCENIVIRLELHFWSISNVFCRCFTWKDYKSNWSTWKRTLVDFISLLQYNNKFHPECTKLWHYAHWMWFSCEHIVIRLESHFWSISSMFYVKTVLIDLKYLKTRRW